MAKAAKNGKVNPKLPAAINPLGVRPVYSNNLDIMPSPLDVRLVFNEILVDQGAITVERRASIVMGIPHFKAMVKVLNAQMKRVEEAEAQFAKALAAPTPSE